MSKTKNGDLSSSTFRGSALKKLKMRVRSLEHRVHDSLDSKSTLTKRAMDSVRRRENRKTYRELSENLRSDNPFDVKTSRLHFSVLNRKTKGILGHPSLSKRRNLEKRYNMLGEELWRKDKKGNIVDQRIDQSDPTVPSEDKTRARFLKETAKTMKKNIFNLEDNDLTHMGQSLSLHDDYDGGNIRDHSDDTDSGDLEYDAVSALNFGGFRLKSNSSEQTDKDSPKKSRAKIMEEIIRKSKIHKHEKRLEREENEKLISEVDESVGKINDLVSQRSFYSEVTRYENNEDAYDCFLVDLSSDTKSKPTDPLLSEKQRAALEAMKLERMEKDRLAKLNSESSLNTQNPDSYVNFSHSAVESEFESIRKPLEYKDGVLVNGDTEEEEDTVDSGDTSNDTDEDVSETCSESGDGTEDLAGDLHCELQDASSDPRNGGEGGSPTTEPADHIVNCDTEAVERNPNLELPFIFKSPENIRDLIGLFKDRTAEQKETVIKRLRTLNNVSLGSREHLEKLTSLMIDYVYYYYRDERGCEPCDIFPVFCQLVELGREFRDAIKKSTKSRYQKLLGSISSFPPRLPSMADCLLFSLITNVYSDCIECPELIAGLLVMCKFIAQKMKFSYERLYKRLWVMDMVIDFISISKKYVPELLYAIEDTLKECICDSELSPDHESCLAIDWSQEVPKFSGLFAPPSSYPGKLSEFLSPTLSDIRNAPILAFLLSLKLLSRVVALYASISGFELAFSSIRHTLNKVRSENLTSTSRVYFEHVSSELETHSLQDAKNRTHLKLQDRFKDAPIIMESPKFFDEFSTDPRLRNGAAAAQRQKSKLLHLYKREKRGAIRDLRRDATVISSIRSQKMEESRTKYNNMIKTVMGQLAHQEGEERSLERKRRRMAH